MLSVPVAFKMIRGLLGIDDQDADLYQAMVTIAKAIGKKFAGVMDNSSFGLYSTSICWRSDLGEIRPSMFSGDPRAHGVHVDDKTQVLHCGVRLVIRLSDRLRLLLAAPSDGRDEDNKNLCNGFCAGETDKVLPSGATLLELKRYGMKLAESDSGKLSPKS